MQRYDLTVAREGTNGKKFWTRIGTAFPSKNGDGFSLTFDALPMPGKDGQCWVSMFVHKDRDEHQEQDRAPERGQQIVTSGRRSIRDDDFPSF